MVQILLMKFGTKYTVQQSIFWHLNKDTLMLALGIKQVIFLFVYLFVLAYRLFIWF